MTDTYGSRHWPLEIRLKTAAKVLEVDFDDGTSISLPAELLRVESPSAEVQGHSPSQKQLVTGKRFVGVTKLEPVGNYAIRIHFDDGHTTGIFSWPYLYAMGQRRDELWSAYLAALAAKGQTRDPF
jgi:DUF971 family protein